MSLVPFDADDTDNHTNIYVCASLSRRGEVELGFTTLASGNNGRHKAAEVFITDDAEITPADGRSQPRLNDMVAKIRNVLQTVTPLENGTYADEEVNDTRARKIQVFHTVRQDVDLIYDFLDQNGFTSGAFIDEEPDIPNTFSIIHDDEDNEISPEDLEENFVRYSAMFIWVPVEFYRAMLVNVLEAWDFNRI
jgi:hypothetical protein